jgi:hypothetical protein
VQVHRHDPLRHTSLGGHAIPHAPQFAGSDVRSTHAPPQLVRGAHELPVSVATSIEPASVAPKHIPAMHGEPEGQWCPHPPQLFGSVCGLTVIGPTHVGSGEAHAIVPDGPSVMHVPDTHHGVEQHRTPHAPQL